MRPLRSPPKGVFEIVNANVSKPRRGRFAVLFFSPSTRSFPSRLPGRVVHLRHRPGLAVFFVRAHEYMDWLQPANALDDRLRNPVEHDETFLAIFYLLARNDKHRRVELRHLHFIVPL